MADENVQGGTVFYRVSDRRDDSVNVRDITLHSAFGDLSDGTAPVLSVKAGIDSKLALMDFTVKPQPKYGGQATMVGFDLNFVTTGFSGAAGNSGLQQEVPLPLCDVYKMKPMEGIKSEGSMQPVSDAHETLSFALNESSTNSWERSNVAAVLAHASYENSHRGLHEDFSGSSDISDTMYKFTSTGKVFSGSKPYITVKDAVDNVSGNFGVNKVKAAIQKYGGGKGKASKVEMAGFYGSTNNDGDTVIFLEPADDGSPPEKWKPSNPVGEKQDLLSHPAFAPTPATGPTIGGGPAVAGIGGGLTAQGYQGSAGLSGTYSKVSMVNDPHMPGVKRPRNDLYLKGSGKATKKGMTTSSARIIKQGGGGTLGKTRYAMGKAPGRLVGGPAMVVVGAAMAVYSGRERAKDLKAARNAGDFSGLNRPYFEPSWKNKDIKNKIKYDKQFEDFTISERDETAMTTTSTWWDAIKEVKDYPKPSTGSGQGDATAVTPGSSEDMFAKSSINFSNENTLTGGNMRMACYHDKDISLHPAEQLDVDFGGTINPLAQDIFVSKYNIPAPIKFFPDNPENSAANQEPRSKYEISFKLNIAEMAQQYTVLENDGTSTSSTTPFRRGMAVTFSNKKPQESDSFADYIQRHGPTADRSNWGSDICGFVIENKPGFGTGGSAAAEGCRVIPLAQVIADDTDTPADGDADVKVNCRESSVLTSDIIFQKTATGTATNTDNIRIPQATWLEFKLSTDQSGASGQNYRRHGRFYLTVHHANDTEKGMLVEDQREGGAFEGPMCLVSPNDCSDASGTGADKKLTNAHGDIDEPFHTTHWLKHMTIWVCNFGNMSGGSFNAAGTAKESGGTRYIHDYLSSGGLNGGVTYNEATTAPKGFKPYFLGKTAIHFDDFKIKNASPSLVNMSVNGENTANSASQNVFNENSRNVIKPGFEPRWAGSNLLIDGRKNANTYETKSAMTPTVLALGFKTTSNLVGSTSDPKFLLFNDFFTTDGAKLPQQMKGNEGSTASYEKEMYAGFTDDTKKLGDFIDIHSTSTESITTVDGTGINNTTDPVTFNVDAGHGIAAGDILKIDSEFLDVTKVATNAITVNRGISSGDSPAAHADGATVHRIGQSLFKKLTIGNVANNDIMTGAADTTDLAYANGSTGKTMYVDGFSQKGVLQFQNAFTNWSKRENIYASARIVSLGTDKDEPDGGDAIDDNTAVITIADRAAIAYDSEEKYIIFKYGETSTPATAFNTSTGNAAIVTILERHENYIKVQRDISTAWGGSSHKGRVLSGLLTESNLPELFICPYRYWVNIYLDAQKGAFVGKYDVGGPTNYDYPEQPERSYGGILPVADPDSGYTVGTTFNEREFSVNGSGQTFYDNVRAFDITEKEDAPYELNTDFGFGVYNNEMASGGQVATFRPERGSNRVNIDRLMAATPQEGDTLGLLLSANGNNLRDSQLHLFSSEVANASFDGLNSTQEPSTVPQLVTKYLKQMPDHPGLAVIPNEMNPSYVEFPYQVGSSDLWYGYLMISKETIQSKYHGIVAYTPLNEDTDNQPWLGNEANMRSENINRLKMYGNESSIGKEAISDTNVDIIYNTGNGTYNDATGHVGKQTLSGLAGRALDTRTSSAGSAIDFPYRAGYINAANTGAGFSLVLHCIPEFNAADGVMWELKPASGNSPIKVEVASAKVKVTCAPNSGTSTVITSARSIPRDGETPICIIVTGDPDITEGNVKLFMDGKLEAQSGPMAATATASQWGYDKSFTGTGSNKYVQLGGFKGIYEECILYGNGTIIYPVEFNAQGGDTSILVTKNFEELAQVDSGAPQIYNAKLFIFDYHNLRGEAVASSPEVSFRKTSFKIDGTA